MGVLVFKNFIDQETCKQLNDWVNLGVTKKWLDTGLSKDVGWTYEKRVTSRKYGERFDYPKAVYKTQEKISSFLAVHDLPKSVVGGGKDGVVVSCTFPGGDVYKHIDPKEGNLEVLRCNILTRAADSGGHLFINDNKIDINVGDLHCYLPSTVEHNVTTVEGNTSRVLWMFGYQCSKERFDKIIKDTE